MVFIDHPAQIHLYKNLIWQLEKDGHTVKIVACLKEVMRGLLDAYDFDYHVLFENKSGNLPRKLMMASKGEVKIMNLARKFHPDIFFSATSEIVGPVSRTFRKPNIGITDTEHANLSNMFAYPATDVILTPSSFKNDLGKKQVRIEGCKELAYLHPNYFKPDPSVLEELKLSEKDNIFMVRFAAFTAGHDAKSEKFSSLYIPQLIDRLKKEGEIVISSEVPLDDSLKKYQYDISPEKYHDLLAYSKLYVGEGSSSANEAGILGVPSLHFERLKDGGRIYGATSICGIMSELQDKYGLICSFYEETKLLEKLDEILADVDRSKNEWMAKRERFLNDKIDVTSFLVWFIENYPESYSEMKQNPDVQFKFK